MNTELTIDEKIEKVKETVKKYDTVQLINGPYYTKEQLNKKRKNRIRNKMQKNSRIKNRNKK